MSKIQNIYQNNTLYRFEKSKPLDFSEQERIAEILVFYEAIEGEGLSKSDADLLDKILVACKLDANQIPKIDVRRIGKLKEVLNECACKKIILFDIAPQRIGLLKTIAPYVITKIMDTDCLFSASLEELRMNTQLKGQLWSQLQLMFKP